MAIRLDFEPEIEELARAVAKAHGMSLEEYLVMLLEEHLMPQKQPTEQEIAGLEADLDALVNGAEKAAPQPNEMLRRTNIYGED